jgi:phosphoglycerate dehydrogenase-like enzyme
MEVMVVRIAVLDDFVGNARTSADWSQLPADASVDFIQEHLSEEAAAEKLRDYEVLVTMRERSAFPDSLLRRLPNLKLILCNGRNTFLDLKAAQELGIRAANSSAMPASPNAGRETPRGEGAAARLSAGGPTGELTWGLMISVMRQLPREVQSVRNGGWLTSSGPGLSGKTLGIVGLGRIGTGVARVAQVFGMNVIAWSQNLTVERAAEHGATLVTKDELFERSDVVTIHLALSERTRGIIGAHELGLMKLTAYLINTARGPIIDEQALIDTLREKRIAGAGMDVFNQEPLPPNHPYRTLDNVVATPHLGYGTDEGYVSFHRGNVRTILAYLAGEPLQEFTL